MDPVLSRITHGKDLALNGLHLGQLAYSGLHAKSAKILTNAVLQTVFASTSFIRDSVQVIYSSCSPFSSDRQYLSYGVRLEVRGEIIRTVLCCIVYDSSTQS